MEALRAEEVKSVIDGKSIAKRMPIILHMWVHKESFGERIDKVNKLLEKYPQDVEMCTLRMPEIYNDASEYSWVPWKNPYTDEQNMALDSKIAIQNWERLDEVEQHLAQIDHKKMLAKYKETDGRYRLGIWWFCLFERHWTLRGMENALMDYYLNPAETHRLYRILTDFYLKAIEEAAALGCHGIMTSDDIGTQSSEFFSEEIFNEFFKPYYKELIEKAHAHKMQFWLHSCGNISKFLPIFIEIGLDVIHPIQKHCMDEVAISAQYQDQITFNTGLDVQQVIPWGSPEEVRQEIHHLMDTFWIKGKGRAIFTTGNGINEDCTIESLSALFEEAYKYGQIIANK